MHTIELPVLTYRVVFQIGNFRWFRALRCQSALSKRAMPR